MDTIVITGDETYGFGIIGENFHQTTLANIAGLKTADIKRVKCTVTIHNDPNNPYDQNACIVCIDQVKVGNLNKTDAARLVNLTKSLRLSPDTRYEAKAVVVGGWKDEDTEGMYRLKLDVPQSFLLMKSA